MQLPNDPVMLMSFCNARLRDEYESLDELCSSLTWTRESFVRVWPRRIIITIPTGINFFERRTKP